jgi:hypothetical protein
MLLEEWRLKLVEEDTDRSKYNGRNKIDRLNLQK